MLNHTDELLIENGYKKNDFVFCLNEEESSRYHAAVMFNTSFIKNKIFCQKELQEC